jgi:tetratricopeptide (TPR) repeat protein
MLNGERCLKIMQESDLLKEYFAAGMKFFLEENYSEAEKFFLLALEQVEATASVASQVNTLGWLGATYLRQERFAQAYSQFARCLSRAEQQFDPNHPEILRILENMACAYSGDYRFAEAEEIYKSASFRGAN